MKSFTNALSLFLLTAMLGTALFVSSCGKKADEKKDDKKSEAKAEDKKDEAAPTGGGDAVAKGTELGSAMCACFDKGNDKALACIEAITKDAEAFAATLKSDEEKKAFDQAGEAAAKPCKDKFANLMK